MKIESCSWDHFFGALFFISSTKHCYFIFASFFFQNKKKSYFKLVGYFVLACMDDGKKRREFSLTFAMCTTTVNERGGCEKIKKQFQFNTTQKI
jgi:hypothetical protein